MVKKIVSLLLAMVANTAITMAELPGQYKIVIPNIPPQERSLDKVQMTEFFSVTCGHCYNFHKNVSILKKKFGDKIEIISSPVGWYGKDPGRLYYIGKQFGKGKLVLDTIFNFVFDQSIENITHKIYQREMLENVALVSGLTDEFNRYMDDPKIIEAMDSAVKRAEDFDIHSTPTIVIEGAIKTSGNITNLIKIINALLKEPVL